MIIHLFKVNYSKEIILGLINMSVVSIFSKVLSTSWFDLKVEF